jgi:nucleoside-diphosphate kinase
MGSARIQYIRENQGFDLVAMEYLFPSVDLLERHYEEHKGKSFFRELVDFMTSGMLESNGPQQCVTCSFFLGPVVAMIWQGRDVVASTRKMLGATDPKNSLPGTIRGDFGVLSTENICHASDSVVSAEREIKLWFPDLAPSLYEGNTAPDL